MKINLNKNWFILQDVHDAIEKLGVDVISQNNTITANQISEWEPIPRLEQLQLLLAEKPYFGRELRQFNNAPWWYKNTFNVKKEGSKYVNLKFTNVDYYCKIYVNGAFAGEHEGYSDMFEFPIEKFVRFDEENILLVKVWSPWDDEVEKNKQEMRTFMVRRNMVKGTYEHSDGLLQRDVNPVGIYGMVEIETFGDSFFRNKPSITYELNKKMDAATIFVSTEIAHKEASKYEIAIQCMDTITGKTMVEKVADSEKSECVIENIVPWSTWDRYDAYLYKICIHLRKDGRVIDSYEQCTGFRKIEMVRNSHETTVILNDEKMYVRGTSYFPDQYISAMSKERYRRDLNAIKAAGFNFIRIHVHIEMPEFYDICDQMGIGIMQDSEYNWLHPFEGDFAERFVEVYTRNIKQMIHHPSILVWVGMNEPGVMELLLDGALETQANIFDNDTRNCRAMAVHPGPEIFEAIKKADASRPIIKGSFCRDDMDSGDSHNYLGSLSGEHTHYLDLYSSTEKFNTEFGFDAVPCLHSFKQNLSVYNRLKQIEPDIENNQLYQYKYMKYVTEHYRLQKYKPCSGYIQFLFNDTTPVSFYGLVDWWGIPKKGLEAMQESNMPLAVIVKFGRERIDAIYAVNDSLIDYGECEAFCTISNNGTRNEFSAKIDLGKDSICEIVNLNILKEGDEIVDIKCILKKSGKIITKNHYEDIFNQPGHPKGHPDRLSHEVGCRLYNL